MVVSTSMTFVTAILKFIPIIQPLNGTTFPDSITYVVACLIRWRIWRNTIQFTNERYCRSCIDVHSILLLNQLAQHDLASQQFLVCYAEDSSLSRS